MAIADKMGLDIDAIQAFRVMFSKDNRKASIKNIKDKLRQTDPHIEIAKMKGEQFKSGISDAAFDAEFKRRGLAKRIPGMMRGIVITSYSIHYTKLYE